MSNSTVNQLLTGIGGGHVTAFFIVLARVTPLFLLAPLFSSRMIPKHVRGIIAVALAIGLTGIASHGQQIPVAPLQIAALLVKEVLVGLGFALILGTLNAALQLAGSLTDASAESQHATRDGGCVFQVAAPTTPPCCRAPTRRA